MRQRKARETDWSTGENTSHWQECSQVQTANRHRHREWEKSEEKGHVHKLILETGKQTREREREIVAAKESAHSLTKRAFSSVRANGRPREKECQSLVKGCPTRAKWRKGSEGPGSEQASKRHRLQLANGLSLIISNRQRNGGRCRRNVPTPNDSSAQRENAKKGNSANHSKGDGNRDS